MKTKSRNEDFKKWKNVIPEHIKSCRNVLNYINNIGIQHNDARTPNFIIIRDNVNGTVKAKILDFGFSKVFDHRVDEDLKDDDPNTVQSIDESNPCYSSYEFE